MCCAFLIAISAVVRARKSRSWQLVASGRCDGDVDMCNLSVYPMRRSNGVFFVVELVQELWTYWANGSHAVQSVC
jgi:hypothetical protein